MKNLNIALGVVIYILVAQQVYAQSGIITTFAGNHTVGISGDGGPATNASLKSPSGIILDSEGNLYIADYRATIRRVAATGIISRYAGTDTGGYAGDGNPATDARLGRPAAMVTDKYGNIYIADQFNHVVRKVNSAGIISSYAGNGAMLYAGDNGPAISASMGFPCSLAIDDAGNLYIGDYSYGVVRKVDPSGIITTFAGNGDFSYAGDGGLATDASMQAPMGLAADKEGNVYISDRSTHTVRKVNTSGIITTIAGNNTQGLSGDGREATAAQLKGPRGIAIDAEQNIYIADQANNRVRKIDAAGIITTIAGGASAGYAGDGGPATASLLANPVDLALDQAGNLYIADVANVVVRRINSSVGIKEIKSIQTFIITPNPSAGEIVLNIPGKQANSVSVLNFLGQVVYSVCPQVNNGIQLVHLPEHLASGNYTLQVFTGKEYIYNSLTLRR